MKRLAMLAQALVESHTTLRSTFTNRIMLLRRATFSQVLAHYYRSHFWHFRVPQRRALALAKLVPTATVTQIPKPVLAAHFVYGQLPLNGSSIEFARFVHTC